MEHAQGGSGERYRLDLNAFVDEYVGLSYHALQARVPDLAVTIERDLDPAGGTVELAAQEMGRALLNVLNNAFDAVHEKAQTVNGAFTPTVHIRTRRHIGGVEIQIQDNGPGIPPALREKIFEPFFTTKPTGTGTGLGLSLAYDIITQGHGGTMTVDSTEGQGSTFTIRLPAPTSR